MPLEPWSRLRKTFYRALSEQRSHDCERLAAVRSPGPESPSGRSQLPWKSQPHSGFCTVTSVAELHANLSRQGLPRVDPTSKRSHTWKHCQAWLPDCPTARRQRPHSLHYLLYVPLWSSCPLLILPNVPITQGSPSPIFLVRVNTVSLHANYIVNPTICCCARPLQATESSGSVVPEVAWQSRCQALKNELLAVSHRAEQELQVHLCCCCSPTCCDTQYHVASMTLCQSRTGTLCWKSCARLAMARGSSSPGRRSKSET